MDKKKQDDIELAGELYPFDSRFEQRSISHRSRASRSKNGEKVKNEEIRENSRKKQEK